MTARGPRARIAGWVLAGVGAAALLCSAAALALAADRKPTVLVLDLGNLPSVAPAVAAIAEAAPQVADEAPPAPEDPTPPEAAPDLPSAEAAPKVSTTAALTLPEPDVSVAADLALPPAPEKPEPPAEKKVAKAKPKTEDAPAKKPKSETPKPVEDTGEAAAKPKDAAAASAPAAGTKASKAKSLSPATYAKAVMKKVHATKKKSGAGRGTVVVGFSIGKDGGLTQVKLLQSSGNVVLDKIAMDHIRRAAPFPSPPADAGRNYSFEFVGK
jgi:protein TonB